MGEAGSGSVLNDYIAGAIGGGNGEILSLCNLLFMSRSTLTLVLYLKCFDDKTDI